MPADLTSTTRIYLTDKTLQFGHQSALGKHTRALGGLPIFYLNGDQLNPHS